MAIEDAPSPSSVRRPAYVDVKEHKLTTALRDGLQIKVGHYDARC